MKTTSSMRPRRRTSAAPAAIVGLLAGIVALVGCGGGLTKEGSVRLLNATTDYASLDLYSASTAVSTGVAAESLGGYSKLEKGSVTLNLRATGSGGVVASSVQDVSTDKNYTLLAYVSGGTLKTSYLDDNEGAPSANAAKFRVFNAAAAEAGNVDVYLTTGTCAALPSSAVPTAAAVSALGTYGEVSVATYRVCVTAAGDKTDLRLDIASVAIVNQQIATLVLTRSSGGVLLNGLLLNQQGALTRAPNGSARLRAVASAAQGASVSVAANGVTLAANAVTAVGTYRVVPAGALTVTASIAGSAVPVTGLTAAPGADLTLLIAGTAAAPRAALINDDNTPSTSSSNSVRLRLVNGLNGLSGGVTLTYDGAIVADAVPFGSASPSVSVVPSTTTSTLDATTGGTSLYTTTGNATPLVAGKVDSLFLLGDATAPRGVFRVDR